MERNGWVRRSPAANDARVTLIESTPAGSKLCARIPALLTRHLAAVFAQFTDKSYDRLIADLKRLRRSMGDG